MSALAFTHDGRYLLSGGAEAVLVVWQLGRDGGHERTYAPWGSLAASMCVYPRVSFQDAVVLFRRGAQARCGCPARRVSHETPRRRWAELWTAAVRRCQGPTELRSTEYARELYAEAVFEILPSIPRHLHEPPGERRNTY